MTAQKGRGFIFQFDTGSSTFAAVAGQRNTSFTINNETVDVTNKDSATAAGALHRILLAQAGVGSCSIALDGVYVDATNYNTLRTAAIDNTHVAVRVQVTGAAIDGYLHGSFAITSIAEAGAYNGEMTYNISLESAGEFDYTLN
jgi:TP901-1 family phage major tail protein